MHHGRMGIADQRIDYETAGLERHDLLDDPIAQWHIWYEQAVSADTHEPNNFCVATVDREGMPDNRYVLVRSVDDRGFAFYTNLDSAKSQQLKANPKAAGVCGWLQLHRQVRVRGSIELVEAAEADAYYDSRPLSSRFGAWSSPQSTVISGRGVLDEVVGATEARFADGAPTRPPFWGGWRIVPVEIEFWQGRPSRLHDRFRYRRDAVSSPWIVERLAP
jgi:pyridoxamine 5'-phosphate oxidase